MSTNTTPINYLSDKMHRRLLGYGRREIPPSKIKAARYKWEKYQVENLQDKLEPIDIHIPEEIPTAIECIDLAHKELRVDRVISRLDGFARASIPLVPDRLPLTPGWWLYEAGRWQRGTFPTAITGVFDFETVPIGDTVYPVCASCVTDKHWYVWIWDKENPVEVIEWGRNSLLIGHQTSYDRSFLANEYKYEATGSLFPCTMSMWNATHAFADKQRGLVNAAREDLDFIPEWLEETGKGGLADIYQFYTGQPLDKGVVKELVDQGVEWLEGEGNFERLVRYNLLDVAATHKIFSYLWPEYKTAYYNPELPLMGELMIYSDLLHSKSWVPMSSSRWPDWYSRNEKIYQETVEKIKGEINQVAERILEEDWWHRLSSDTPSCPIDATEYQRQLISLDWVVTHTRKLKSGKVVDRGWSVNKNNPETPLWYRKAKKGFTLGSRITPLLLGFTWKDKPLIWENGWITADEHLPHPEKRGQRVTDLFMQGMGIYIRQDVLKSQIDTKEILKMLSQIRLWTSFRKRFKSIRTQNTRVGDNTIPVWLTQDTRYPGTISFRVSGVLQLLPNKGEESYSDKLGCSIKSLIEAPSGYRIMGGDADSQELKTFAMLGDALHGFHGSQPGSLMSLLGSKKDKTTLHWILALKACIEYGLAKNCIYGSIYGLAVTGLTDYFLKANALLTHAAAKKMAEETLELLKGLNDYGVFKNGLLSDSFNRVKQLAQNTIMRTVITGRKISKALRNLGRDYMTTRVNWIVQSAGSDQRQLVIVFMHWLLRKYNIDARLITPIHDEFRYCVNEDDIEQFNWAFQLSHLLMQSIIVDRLGLDGITCSHAYFPDVEVDTILRSKNTYDTMETLCNPTPISPGYILKPKVLERYIPSFR